MSKQQALKIFALALLTTFLLLLIWIGLNHRLDGTIWNGMTLSKSALTVEYCEWNNTAAFFHQRMNTYSNLAYFFLGIIIIGIAGIDNKSTALSKNSLQQFPGLSFFLGGCLIYLCFASAFFHASLTWVGQRIDMNGTYGICLGLIGISWYRLLHKATLSGKSKRIFIGCLLLLLLLFVKLHLLIKATVLLPVLIGLIMIPTSLIYRKHKQNFRLQYALLGAAFMIGAMVLRTMDVAKVNCDPHSFYQGHALWHVLTGMSAFFMYWFYRNERIV